MHVSKGVGGRDHACGGVLGGCDWDPGEFEYGAPNSRTRLQRKSARESHIGVLCHRHSSMLAVDWGQVVTRLLARISNVALSNISIIIKAVKTINAE